MLKLSLGGEVNFERCKNFSWGLEAAATNFGIEDKKFKAFLRQVW